MSSQIARRIAAARREFTRELIFMLQDKPARSRFVLLLVPRKRTVETGEAGIDDENVELKDDDQYDELEIKNRAARARLALYRARRAASRPIRREHFVPPDITKAMDIPYPTEVTAAGLVTLSLNLSLDGQAPTVQVLRDTFPDSPRSQARS